MLTELFACWIAAAVVPFRLLSADCAAVIVPLSASTAVWAAITSDWFCVVSASTAAWADLIAAWSVVTAVWAAVRSDALVPVRLSTAACAAVTCD